MKNIFDNIFRTLCEKNPKLLIPIINYIFKTAYSIKDSFSAEKLDLLSGKHHFLNRENTLDNSENKEEIETDSLIRIGNKLYHIECQSTSDGTMILRMVEYDFHIALERAIRVDDVYEMEFPNSAVVFLRNNGNIPNEMQMSIRFPDGQKIIYKVPTVKVQSFDVAEILDKKLFFFIPYYILRYEKSIKTVDKNKLIDEYQRLYLGMEKAYKDGLIEDYDMSNIIQFTKELTDYICSGKNDNVKEGVAKVMGGVVLETYADEHAKTKVNQSIRENALKTATYLISLNNLTPLQISEASGLSLEEVENLMSN